MRKYFLKFAHVDIPSTLIEASRKGSLVIFAGSGVSKQDPVCFPDFNELVQQIRDSKPDYQRCRYKNENEANEVYLSYLDSKAKGIRKRCAEILQTDLTTELHRNILKLASATGEPKVVTTNFDPCFATAAKETKFELPQYSAPALPLGDSFDGLIHLHGNVNKPDQMVLLAEDYGTAYVSKGWASRFLVDLFNQYCVVFVGYSAGDTTVDYLLRSLGPGLQETVFALDRNSNDTESWLQRGVKPIAFNEYEQLPQLFGEWTSYISNSTYSNAMRISTIAQNGTYPSEDDAEFLRDCFSDSFTKERNGFVSILCQNAKSKELLRWLFENNYLSCLFEKCTENWHHSIKNWVIDTFAFSNRIEVSQLSADYRRDFSSSFYSALLVAISDHLENTRSVRFWLTKIRNRNGSWASGEWYILNKIVQESKDEQTILLAIEAMLAVGQTYEEHNWLNSATAIRPTMPLIDREPHSFDPALLKKLQSSSIRRLFLFSIEKLQQAYDILMTGCNEEEPFDADSFHRAAIESHKEDSIYSGRLSMLVDVLRDCGEYLLGNEDDWFINDFCHSPYALFKRLGIHFLRLSSANYDTKITAIVDLNLLGDVDCRHETFLLAKHSYANVNPSNKEKLLTYARQALKFDLNEREKSYPLFSFASWLYELDQDDDITRSILDEIAEHYPEFEEREHPDLLVSTSRLKNYDPLGDISFTENEFTYDKTIELFSANRKHELSAAIDTWPDTAFLILKKLVTSRLDDNTAPIAQAIIERLNWMLILDKDHKLVVSILLHCLDDRRLFNSAIRKLSFSKTQSISFAHSEWILFIKKGLSHYEWCLDEKNEIKIDNSTDWMMLGLNNTSGMLANLFCYFMSKDEIAFTEQDYSVLGAFVAEGHFHSKCAIACCFTYLNKWIDQRPRFAETYLIPKLENDTDAAWAGLSYCSRISQDTWQIIQTIVHKRVSTGTSLPVESARRLAALFVWTAMVWETDLSSRIKFISETMAGSSDQCSAAMHHLGNWLDNGKVDNRSAVWDEWLHETLEQTLKLNHEVSEQLIECLFRWIIKFEDLQRQVVDFILKCKPTEFHNGFIFVRQALDALAKNNFEPSMLVSIMIFVLKYRETYLDGGDLEDRIKGIDFNSVDEKLRNDLADEVTKIGRLDLANLIKSAPDSI